MTETAKIFPLERESKTETSNEKGKKYGLACGQVPHRSYNEINQRAYELVCFIFFPLEILYLSRLSKGPTQSKHLSAFEIERSVH